MGRRNNSDKAEEDYEIEAADLVVEEQHFASGGMGKVYKGVFKRKEVAVKAIDVTGFGAVAEGECRREAEVMYALNHDNIVRFFGLCVKPKEYQLVMEYMAGGSLHESRGRVYGMNWNGRYGIALDISAGLAYLHSQDIIHRDIKSPNVLLNRQFRAKLADFGLARMQHHTTLSTAAKGAGTPRWMAPEFCDTGMPTKATDVFAMGVVFWEISSGKLPWESESNALSIPLRVARGAREVIPAETPDGFKAIIESCWHQNVAERSSADMVKHKLELYRVPAYGAAAAAGGAAAAAAVATGPRYDTGIASRDRVPAYGAAAAGGAAVSSSREGAKTVVTKSSRTGEPRRARAKSSADTTMTDYERGLKYYNALTYHKAIYYLKRAAEYDSSAQNLLGHCYERGLGTGVNESEAAYYYGLASAQNHAGGQYNLARFNEAGKGGLAKDNRNARRLFHLAGEKKLAAAEYVTGRCYETGVGVEPDLAKAKIWYEKAAAQNYELARTALARLASNSARAAALARRRSSLPRTREHPHPKAKQASNASAASAAATAGDIQAQAQADYESGKAYADKKEREKALPYFIRAAEQGHAEAKFSLYFYYQTGLHSVAKNETKALQLLREAAELGLARAQCIFGSKYLKGNGLRKNEEEALIWFKRAEAQGSAWGQLALAECYEKGWCGLRKNEGEALRLYLLAADQKNSFALHSLGLCYSLGELGLEKDETKALNFYREAIVADSKNANVQYSLGFYYEHGKGGVIKNEAEALRRYRLAVECGAKAVQADVNRLLRLHPHLRQRSGVGGRNNFFAAAAGGGAGAGAGAPRGRRSSRGGFLPRR